MIHKDDRTEEQRRTHKEAVVAKDTFCSGWGAASGGVSRVAWACECISDAKTVLEWVRKRSDMREARIVHLDRYRPTRSTVHFHIYVVNESHPALTNARAEVT